MNDRSEDEFHRETHLSAIHNNARRTTHEGIMNHAQQVAEVNSPLLTSTFTEVNDDEAFVGRWDIATDEWIGRINRWHTLEIDVRFAELRTNVIDVIRHAAQDRVNDRFC